jgi:hypothetical protein
MSYTLHPSKRLVSMFKEKPWQGSRPEKAHFLFVGLDANYSADIEKSLPEVFDYLYSGVEFWREKGVHHPFRLPQYRGSGKKYHDKFAEIGFTSEHAELVSFVELLHLPTTGGRNLKAEDLSLVHLNSLMNIFDRGDAKYIFMSSSVTNILRQAKMFPWLRRNLSRMDGDLTVLREHDGQIIYEMYHLSCYGRQLDVLNRQILQIRNILESLY